MIKETKNMQQPQKDNKNFIVLTIGIYSINVRINFRCLLGFKI